MVSLATFDRLLSIPVEVTALIAKYQVPADRFSTMYAVSPALLMSMTSVIAVGLCP